MSTQYRTQNPATNELIREYPTLTDAEAEALLAKAHEAFLTWRFTPVEQRVEAYRRLSELLEKHSDALARQATLEMGKTLVETSAEVLYQAKAMVDYYAGKAEELLAPKQLDVPGMQKIYTQREAVGVVLGIGPWNGPYYQGLRVASPNIMLGNTVIGKPAPICAGSTLMLDELFLDAGFPEGVYQTGLLSNEQVSKYIADDRVRGVTFTGSDATGRIIAAQAGQHVKPTILELGGSDPFVVLDSGDPIKAAANAGMCRMFIGGQVCCSPKRLIVTEKNAEPFIEQISAHFANLKMGDPFDESTNVGPLSSVEHADRVGAQVQDAVDKGAKVLVGSGRVDGPGAWFSPTVITGITPEMRMYSEEVFGPVAMVYVVPDNEAALALANDTKYGLGGTVFAEDADEAAHAARVIDAGMLGVNGWLGGPVEMPFGGTKASGYGRELGEAGMDAFSNLKTYGVAG